MFGRKLGRTHPDIERMMALSDNYDKLLTIGFGMELDLFPWLKFFNIHSMRLINDHRKDMDQLFDKYIKDYRVSLFQT